MGEEKAMEGKNGKEIGKLPKEDINGQREEMMRQKEGVGARKELNRE